MARRQVDELADSWLGGRPNRTIFTRRCPTGTKDGGEVIVVTLCELVRDDPRKTIRVANGVRKMELRALQAAVKQWNECHPNLESS